MRPNRVRSIQRLARIGWTPERYGELILAAPEYVKRALVDGLMMEPCDLRRRVADAVVDAWN